MKGAIPMSPVFIALICIVSVSTFLYGLHKQMHTHKKNRRLKDLTGGPTMTDTPLPAPRSAPAPSEALSRFVKKAAALQLRQHEYIMILVMAFVLPAALGALLRGIIGAALLGFVGLGTILAIFHWLSQRYLALTDKALPDFLRGVINALQSGSSLPQAMNLVAKETPDPLGSEIQRTLRQEAFGVPLERALNDLTTRLPSKDLALTVLIITIQRETGGSLADILDNIVQTLVDRQRLVQEVKALTAQGRFSGWILTALPIILGVVIGFLNPSYMLPLFHTTLGYGLLGGASLSIALGSWSIHKMVQSPGM